MHKRGQNCYYFKYLVIIMQGICYDIGNTIMNGFEYIAT